MDSKFQFPRCLATANNVGAVVSAGEWRLLERQKQLYRFAEADDRSDNSAAPTVDRPQPDRSPSKPLPIWRGTEISNPFPSSGERDGMGQAARRWHHRRCNQLMECPDAPAERLEQVPRRLGPR